jgi:hypothetical protein
VVKATEERCRACSVETLVVIEDTDLQDWATLTSLAANLLAYRDRARCQAAEDIHSFRLAAAAFSVDLAGPDPRC